MNWRCVPSLLFLAAMAPGLAASPESIDEARASIGANRFVAADVVELRDEVRGSAFLAGGRVLVDGQVGGSAWVAGGIVEVRGPIGRNLHAAGGEVRIDGRVDGRVQAAGGEVRVSRTAEIAGNAVLAGGRVEVEGAIGGKLRAYGESVYVNGVVEDDLSVAGESVRIGPEARIGGRLRYRGTRDIEVAPGAEIKGGIQRQRRVHERWSDHMSSYRSFGGRPLLFGALLGGVLLLLIAPKFSRAAATRLRSEPLVNGLVGLLLLIGIPVAALLSIVTIIGVPLGLLLLFSCMLLLVLGAATAMLTVGDAALTKIKAAAAVDVLGWRLLFLLLAALLLWLVSRVPVVGRLAVFLLLLAGMGAFAQQAWQHLRGGAVTPPAAGAGPPSQGAG